jgi:hypothetical protein
MSEQNDFFGEAIYSYTRAQAIDDGVLVDLSDPSFTFRRGLNILKEAGIKFPLAMTQTAFARTVQELGEPLPPAQDLSGRLWDVLTMLKFAIKNGGNESTLSFSVCVWNWVYAAGKRTERTKQETVQLKAVCGPGDNAEPVITVMLPDED